jgi:hypothetical protein
MFASYWPTQKKNEFGVADKLNSQPKFVVPSTLDKGEWNNTTVFKGSVQEEIHRLKQRPGGDIRLSGSAMLAQALMQAGLVDDSCVCDRPCRRDHSTDHRALLRDQPPFRPEAGYVFWHRLLDRLCAAPACGGSLDSLDASDAPDCHSADGYTLKERAYAVARHTRSHSELA